MSLANPTRLFLAIVILIAVVAAAIFVWHPIDRIPPRDMTITRFMVLEVRVRAFFREAGKAPSGLSKLEKLQDRDNSIVDGWNRPIAFAINGTTVSLSSLGEDGKPGGADAAADLQHTFDLAKDPYR